MSISFESAASAVRDALPSAGRGLVEREAMVELVALSAVAGEHLLVIGPPGTAKSEAVRRTARVLGARTSSTSRRRRCARGPAHARDRGPVAARVCLESGEVRHLPVP
ncbi:hypothetical protein [Myxococcus xanthus]|uniref:hypothetical protein n=1 Tax=Myxococcus xanthus TaxID=34 RepID=UPI001163DA43|nr:hypothetical protein [Myxococcus xanthus]QDF00629.1 hypothetical protein BHS05_35035 [Myxococcus xanthus]